MSVRYIKLPLFESLSGYTPKSIHRKIEDGVWLEGREFKRAPDGHILVDLKGYEAWGRKYETDGVSPLSELLQLRWTELTKRQIGDPPMKAVSSPPKGSHDG